MIDQPESSQHFTVRVSAGDTSREPLAVRVALYGSGDGSVELVKGVTPLEMAASGRVLSGIVQSVDPAAQVMVDVFTDSESAEPRLLMSARARTVLLGENLVTGTGRFIRGAP